MLAGKVGEREAEAPSPREMPCLMSARGAVLKVGKGRLCCKVLLWTAPNISLKLFKVERMQSCTQIARNWRKIYVKP